MSNQQQTTTTTRQIWNQGKVSHISFASMKDIEKVDQHLFEALSSLNEGQKLSTEQFDYKVNFFRHGNRCTRYTKSVQSMSSQQRDTYHHYQRQEQQPQQQLHGSNGKDKNRDKERETRLQNLLDLLTTMQHMKRECDAAITSLQQLLRQETLI